MIRLVLTGFEPFLDYPVNPTGDLALSVAAPEGVQLIRKVLPVDFQQVSSGYPQWLDNAQPDAILNLGLAALPGLACPERVAIRHGVEPGKLEDHQARHHHWDGPPAFESCVDTLLLTERMREAGIPAAPSFHAGTYLCNYVFYASLRWLQTSCRAMFLHLPFDTATAAELSREPAKRYPSLPAAHLATAVSLSMQALVDTFDYAT